MLFLVLTHSCKYRKSSQYNWPNFYRATACDATYRMSQISVFPSVCLSVCQTVVRGLWELK